MFRLRIEDLAEVKYQKFGVIEVSDLYGDLKRSRNILLLKQWLFMNSELSNTPILIPYKFFLLYLFFAPLFRISFQKTPDSGEKDQNYLAGMKFCIV